MPKGQLRPGTLNEVKDYLARNGYALKYDGAPYANGRIRCEYRQTGKIVVLYEVVFSGYSFGVLLNSLAKTEGRKATVIHREIIGL